MDAIQKYLTMLAPTLMDASTPVVVNDFFHAIWMAVALLIVRLVSDKIAIPIIQSQLRRLKPGAHEKADKAAVHVFDDFFIGEGNALYCLVEDGVDHFSTQNKTSICTNDSACCASFTPPVHCRRSIQQRPARGAGCVHHAVRQLRVHSLEHRCLPCRLARA